MLGRYAAEMGPATLYTLRPNIMRTIRISFFNLIYRCLCKNENLHLHHEPMKRTRIVRSKQLCCCCCFVGHNHNREFLFVVRILALYGGNLFCFTFNICRYIRNNRITRTVRSGVLLLDRSNWAQYRQRLATAAMFLRS